MSDADRDDRDGPRHSSAEVELRPARPEDRHFEFELFASTDAGGVLAHLDEPLRTQLAQMQFDAQERAYVAEFPDAIRSIVVHDGTDAGRVWIDDTDEQIHLIDIAVSPTAQRRGIGSAVFGLLTDRAATSRRPIRFHVAHSNVGARSFYDALGCREISRGDVHSEYEFRVPPPTS